MHPSIVMTRVEYFLAANLAGGGFDTTALKDLDLLDAGVKRCLCKLHVSKSMSNRYGTLHGGCIGELGAVIAGLWPCGLTQLACQQQQMRLQQLPAGTTPERTTLCLLVP